ncbi:hypothetical protein RSOLAG1IB_00085 [Rhizoctonia solani AG-1 IB]|uniref:Uncharacterized protein n=1 Tax=Thanatephorus cucumeris (strain AG1-IB / isolate 7/3/14) TaxID=1108050 RepID=A0A0B7F232_THACB|nr:hypothetical protein RSOLAG1IB_00085 [Rhizoctonia solani AG-1 IB]
MSAVGVLGHPHLSPSVPLCAVNSLHVYLYGSGLGLAQRQQTNNNVCPHFGTAYGHVCKLNCGTSPQCIKAVSIYWAARSTSLIELMDAMSSTCQLSDSSTLSDDRVLSVGHAATQLTLSPPPCVIFVRNRPPELSCHITLP